MYPIFWLFISLFKSANNPSELLTQIERSIQYEKDPSENIDHFNQALGIASTQGPGYGGLTDSQFNDLLWNDFLSDYTYERKIKEAILSLRIEKAFSKEHILEMYLNEIYIFYILLP